MIFAAAMNRQQNNGGSSRVSNSQSSYQEQRQQKERESRSIRQQTISMREYRKRLLMNSQINIDKLEEYKNQRNSNAEGPNIQEIVARQAEEILNYADLLEFQQDLENDQSIRGRKIASTRIRVQSQGKLWVILTVLLFLIAIISSLIDTVPFSASCVNQIMNTETADCTCTHLLRFLMIGHLFICIIPMIMNIRIAHYTMKWYPLRRNIKIMDRFKLMTAYPFFIGSAIWIIIVFIQSEQMFGNTCKDYENLSTIRGIQQVSVIIVLLHTMYVLFEIITEFVCCRRRCQRAKRLKKRGKVYESSDEEDDRDFLEGQLRKRRDDQLRRRRIAAKRVSEVAQQRAQEDRVIRLNRGRELLIEEENNSQQVEYEVDHAPAQQNLEEKALINRALPWYIQNLEISDYKDYLKRHTVQLQGENDCSICLETFGLPGDIIIVYECNPKHFYHLTCGIEWLKTRTECPLCRIDFKDKILEINNQEHLFVNEPNEASVSQVHLQENE